MAISLHGVVYKDRNTVETQGKPFFNSLTDTNVGADRFGPLTTHSGSLSVSTDDQTFEGLDIHGLVSVGANVDRLTLKKCRYRGSDLSGAPIGESGTGLIKVINAGLTSVLCEDGTHIPDFPSFDWDGSLGHDITHRRCLFVHCLDGMGVFNTNAPGTPVNVTFDSCYMNWFAYFSPTQSSNADKQSHNDGLQILGGTSIYLVNNVIYGFRSMPDGWATAHGVPQNPGGDDPFGYCGTGADPTGTHDTGDPSNPSNPFYPSNATNSAIQFNATQGTPGDVIVERNWFDGGAATINIAATLTGASRFTDNRFGRGQRLQGSGGDTTYTFIGGGSALAAASSGNVYDDTGAPVKWDSSRW